MFEWLLLLLVISVIGLGLFGPKELRDGLEEAINKFRGPKDGTPTHPVPVTGSIETSRGRSHS